MLEIVPIHCSGVLWYFIHVMDYSKSRKMLRVGRNIILLIRLNHICR